jgi:hypothetical protein
MKKEKKEKRFSVSQDEILPTGTIASIIVDNETGVHYILVNSTYGTGITPLLDDSGKVIVGSL